MLTLPIEAHKFHSRIYLAPCRPAYYLPPATFKYHQSLIIPKRLIHEISAFNTPNSSVV